MTRKSITVVTVYSASLLLPLNQDSRVHNKVNMSSFLYVPFMCLGKTCAIILWPPCQEMLPCILFICPCSHQCMSHTVSYCFSCYQLNYFIRNLSVTFYHSNGLFWDISKEEESRKMVCIFQMQTCHHTP